MLPPFLRTASRLLPIFGLAVALSGCLGSGDKGEVTGSIGVRGTAAAESGGRSSVDTLAARYRAKPGDAGAGLAYAQALRSQGQRAQAVAVLQETAIKNSGSPQILAAYGRALAEAGQLKDALEVLAKAHRPDQPDWTILNAQGAILDQLGNQAEAQRYYATALKIAPGEPSILSNLGLSYALAKDLKRAEEILRLAATSPKAGPKVRENLALVLRLQGKPAEIAAGAEPAPIQATAALRQAPSAPARSGGGLLAAVGF